MTKMNNVQDESVRDRKKSRRRDLLLEIAGHMIAANGLKSLKVRDIASAAGCSIGSIYNEFGDFDGLILTISRRTVRALAARLARLSDAEPVTQLYGLADEYLSYATEHGNLLRALFEHRMEDDKPFPDDLLAMVMHTFALMHAPLVRLLPDRDPAEIALLARVLFSAVHGIISLGLEERLVAVPPDSLRKLVRQFVKTHLIGIGIAVPD
jgi:AcrR family transcriptional regulator